MVAGSYYFKGAQFSLGVFLGAFVVTANLYLISAIMKKGFHPRNKEYKVKFKPLFFFGFILKSVLLFGSVIAAIYYYEVNEFAFLLGISVLFISLTLQHCIE